ncbi:NADH-quinone oxidoreductase subunit N [Enterobacteriaceae endosymbiont of Donacia tomentosa]|uniref:NADH-quinone oxidoreductase subunit N n=1 Tax=Enterobacteriaceae endosymbiont of Donacia tomentosa TaxID=2675787 RepID=UPI001448B9BF|nr:NADH-quinone oxidoreductase subunit N [Enterobacteriaceae endosymbiont of Donacia tomentosa]QJC31789.1 NADH-quinone oxidoreductase subunit N [Enterobacteriaceae endosymbiont of Donacia tomentosa]
MTNLLSTSLTPLIVIIITVLILLIKISIRRDNLLSLIITNSGLLLTIISIIYLKDINFSKHYLLLNSNYTIFYTIILLITNILICLISYPWIESHFNYYQDEFYLLTLIVSMGGMVLTNSNNFISMLIGTELISIPILGLISYNLILKNSLEASIKYIILSSIASSFLIFGISFIYFDYGNLNFTYLLTHYSSHVFLKNHLNIIGLCFILVSLAFKLSIVPFHLWTPDVYQGSPLPAIMFLSTFSKSVFFVFLVRFLVYFFKINGNGFILYKIIILLSILSIIFGNFMACVTKNNIKRLLGYSSISHMGYLLIIIIYNQLLQRKHLFSLEMMSIYIIGYIINNLGIFGIMSILSNYSYFKNNNLDKLYYYRGLFWYDPVSAFILTVMLLSLAGIPITIGFISKFFLIALSIKTQLWYLTGIIILGSSVGLYYYLHVIISLYLMPSKSNKDTYLSMKNNDNFSINFAKNLILILAILTILLGIYPESIIYVYSKLKLT